MSNTIPSRSIHDRSRAQLYDIAATDTSLSGKRRQIVEHGAEYLGVNLGFVSRIDTAAGRFEVLESTDEELLAAGAVYDLSKTYCRRCVENDSALAVTDTLEAGWEGDPAYEEHGLGCYLGTPIHIDGSLVGTLCFADAAPRERAFSSSERAFVELAAQLLGREQEIRDHERALDEREARLDRRREVLEASELKYESLVTTAPDAIFVAHERTGEIVEVNDAAEELAGLSADQLRGQPMEMFHPSDHNRYWAEFQRFISNGDGAMSRYSDGTHLKIERADGTLVPVEISAKQVTLDGERYIQGVIRDVTERHERERELRVKNRAIDEAAIGITIADATGSDLPLVYANEQFQNLTGYDETEILGESCRFLQGPQTDEERVADIAAALADEQSVETELLNYRKDGTPFWNDLTIAPVEDSDGTVTHFVGFQQDVTDRRRKEKLITVLNRVLRHNLRNGMSVVINRSEQLREKLGPDPPDPLDDVLSRAEQLTAVGEKAGDISKNIANETTVGPVDIVPMVERVAERLDATHDHAEIGVDAPESQYVLATDSLQTALDELGTNAVEHTDANPTVTFDIERTDSGVAIHVRDDGPGLPPEEQTVLERGYETPLEHGSGLGLWFVAWVVTGLGGHVTATVDDGTTMTLHVQAETATTDRDHQSAIGR